MKAGTTELLKFKKLCMRLNLRQWEAVGILESLWMITAKNAPQGDIGKFSNDDIAIALDWSGDAEQLVSALVDCGWIDRDDDFRLLIHGWSEHCPTYIKGNNAKHGKMFADKVAKQAAKQLAKEPPKQPPKESANSNVLPSQVNPSQTNPPPPTPSGQDVGNKTDEEAAVELLISAGVQFAVQAIRPAFANGATLQDIEQIVEFYNSRPGAYDPNALQRKVTNFCRTEPIDKGWPTPKTKWLRDQQIAERNRQMAGKERSELKAQALNQTVVEARKNKHGPYVEALSDSQLRELIINLPMPQTARENMLKGITKRRKERWFLQDLYRYLDQQESTPTLKFTQAAGVG